MDEIRIDNLEIYCHHGLLKEETVLGQKFLLSLVLYTDTRKAGRTDDLSFSVDYADIAHFTEKKMKEKNYKLIEAAAEHLAEDILIHYPSVRKVCVELKKPWAPILLPLDSVSVKIERQWTRAYLSIGSNMGDKQANVEQAVVALMKDERIENVKMSKWIETEPYGYVDQEKFLNAAISIDTLYSPQELLEFLQKVEKDGHRERTIRWGPRTIDLDIIFFGDKIINEEELMIPHRDMQNRDFVLVPLEEIAPWAVHPVFHKTVSEMLTDFKKRHLLSV